MSNTFAKIINLNNGKQVVIMKDMETPTTGPKYVVQIFHNAPEKQKKDIPFVLYFKAIFENKEQRDRYFNNFDEIFAIDFLMQVQQKTKIEKLGKNIFK